MKICQLAPQHGGIKVGLDSRGKTNLTASRKDPFTTYKFQLNTLTKI